jgi:DNA-binding GntR family transcriptional regulator
MKERLELDRLAEQLDTMYARFGHDNDPELKYVVHTLHFELHMRIAEYARCQELKDAIEKSQVLIYNWFFDLAADRRVLPSGFHTELMHAVTGSDPLLADEAMRAHVHYGAVGTLQQTVPHAANDWRLRRPSVNRKDGEHD